ncbi:MAG: hypothetical protein IJZ61_02705 [Oscillospiraceae bacterium]|nr:hypothetical protein [Oscillospiraceae bacterium]
MFNKKFIAIALSMLCLTGCASDNDIQQTSVSETTTVAETAAKTTAATESPIEEDIVEEIKTEATVIRGEYLNPEQGLVFFIQPSISQLDEDSYYDDWTPRDTAVKHEYHYEDEWNYTKELVFVFSNYNEVPVTIDSIEIYNTYTADYMTFANGSDRLEIDFTVQPGHKTDYLLRSEIFNYSACESGKYFVRIHVGEESSVREFFINNCGVYSEKHISENYISFDEETGELLHHEYTVYAPDFLTEEQQEIFAKAHGTMWDWFWCEHYMPEAYTDAHTTEDFMTMLYGIFTEEYANKLAAVYIDENGNLMNLDGARGSHIDYFDHCFFPISADENRVEFKAVVTYCHSDNPYEVSFEDDFRYVMVNTENGWRVDRFDVWN